MPSFASVLTSMACLLAVSNALPHATPRAASKCPAPGEQARHAPSNLYNIFPKAPDVAKDSLGFHLETYQNASRVEQVLVFTGIPANAKSCSVGWDQGDRTERVFIVKGGDALTGVKQLSGFPDNNKVTYNTIKPFDTAENDLGGADFTNWDDLEPQGHTVGAIDCTDSIYLKAALRNPNGNTKVFLNQDDDNGVYISYTC
ncbi:hypothetical protein QQX98_008412 [Neonectria punicea]|uniref:Ubiquitin 3 binding protein But2 C-terminal domain-containing protein n=1 Tax=Neonectria punicea TaxID=979145 RepID=A0ABR1GWB6_9HYPO